MSLKPLILPLSLAMLLAACGPSRPLLPKEPPATATVSPNGEPLPFRAGADDCRGALAAWFARADSNGDGVLDLAEMQADAARWFAIADLDHDGQITSDELTQVRRRLAPEPEPEAVPGMENGHGLTPQHLRSHARVDPVMQADANADFRVTAQEFRAFVAAQFADKARNGVVTQAQVLDACRQPAE